MNTNARLYVLIVLTSTMILAAACTKDAAPEMSGNPIVQDTTSTPSTPVEALDFTNCDTIGVTYSANIVPLIQDNNCLQCHAGEEPRGGVLLNTYEGVKAVADAGRLYGALAWQSGFEAMPQGQNRLPDCDIANVKAWIDAGAPNN